MLDLGYTFRQPALLTEALTHPSLVKGKGERGYERLEFLGDRVLGLIIAEMLLAAFPGEMEGEIAKRHAALVRRETLAQVAENLGIPSHLRVPPGDTSCAASESVLADACEAVIGALYQDGGLDAARPFVQRYWAEKLTAALKPPQDAKSALQEWAQGQGHPRPVYEIASISGPAHRPVFTIAVTVAGLPCPVHADGPTRKSAEQEAAVKAMEILKINY